MTKTKGQINKKRLYGGSQMVTNKNVDFICEVYYNCINTTNTVDTVNADNISTQRHIARLMAYTADAVQ